MRLLASLAVRLLIVLAWGCPGSLWAGQKIPLKELPAPVAATLRKQFAAGTPISAERGDERNDFVYYSIVLREGKSERPVTITEFGEVIVAPR